MKKTFQHSSGRVKCIDFHPTMPWMVTSLHDGTMEMHDRELNTVVKGKVCDGGPHVAVRAVCFVPNENWVVTGSDDCMIRVFAVPTLEAVHEFKAHGDYIRSLDVHPQLPLVLSAGDDGVAKMWDWSKGWECVREFRGHQHYIMMARFDKTETASALRLATASLDGTVRVWNEFNTQPVSTFRPHPASAGERQKGINCVTFFNASSEIVDCGGARASGQGDKVCGGSSRSSRGCYIACGDDNNAVTVWDYVNQTEVARLCHHSNNVSSVCALADGRLLVATAEDGQLSVWGVGAPPVATTAGGGVLSSGNGFSLLAQAETGVGRGWVLCPAVLGGGGGSGGGGGGGGGTATTRGDVLSSFAVGGDTGAALYNLQQGAPAAAAAAAAVGGGAAATTIPATTGAPCCSFSKL